MFMKFIKPLTSIHAATCSFFSNKRRRFFSRVMYSVTLTSGRNRFQCYSVSMPEALPSALTSQDLLRGHSIPLHLECGVHSNLLPRNLSHEMSQRLTIPVKSSSI
ncbi:hypothetical protein TNCT_737041 [Trichonephila clavata]|uniref:Uncharacterized protein n=1 Tax=Trichonephila clavata TaxID=2740835 RepID=A0A8X6KWM1_TRICU|nr:hypothetical protein TNCT_737041 [Trichonephila clavata]